MRVVEDEVKRSMEEEKEKTNIAKPHFNKRKQVEDQEESKDIKEGDSGRGVGSCEKLSGECGSKEGHPKQIWTKMDFHLTCVNANQSIRSLWFYSLGSYTLPYSLQSRKVAIDVNLCPPVAHGYVMTSSKE